MLVSIIKSQGRKSPSFAQLVKYMNKGRNKEDEYFYTHNIYSDKPYYIVREFLENHKNLEKRSKEVNSLFHELISIKKQNGYSEKELIEILKDMTAEYVRLRAENCLVYGTIHIDKQSIHMHLAICSNEILSEKPLWFKKFEYDEIKKNVNKFAFEKYPRLEIIQEKKEKEKTKERNKRKTKSIDNEIQFKKRTGKASDREKFKERLKTILSLSKTIDEFNKYLRVENIEIYARGNTFGFLDRATGKKYRLKTLELETEFEKMNYDFKAQMRDNKSFDDEPHINKNEDDNKKKSNFKERLHKVREKKKEKNKNFEKER